MDVEHGNYNVEVDVEVSTKCGGGKTAYNDEQQSLAGGRQDEKSKNRKTHKHFNSSKHK